MTLSSSMYPLSPLRNHPHRNASLLARKFGHGTCGIWKCATSIVSLRRAAPPRRQGRSASGSTIR